MKICGFKFGFHFFWIQSRFEFEKCLGFELTNPILKGSDSKVKNVDSHTSEIVQQWTEHPQHIFLLLHTLGATHSEFSALGAVVKRGRFSHHVTFRKSTLVLMLIFVIKKCKALKKGDTKLL